MPNDIYRYEPVKVDPEWEDQYMSDSDDYTEKAFLNWARNTYGFAVTNKDIERGLTPFDGDTYNKAKKQFAYMRKKGRQDLSFGDFTYDPWGASDDDVITRSDFVSQNNRAPTDVELSSFREKYKKFQKYGDVDTDKIVASMAELFNTDKDADGNAVTYDLKRNTAMREMAKNDAILSIDPSNLQAKYDNDIIRQMLEQYDGKMAPTSGYDGGPAPAAQQARMNAYEAAQQANVDPRYTLADGTPAPNDSSFMDILLAPGNLGRSIWKMLGVNKDRPDAKFSNLGWQMEKDMEWLDEIFGGRENNPLRGEYYQ